MIDITALKHAYDYKDISNVRFVPTSVNATDDFTKKNRCSALTLIL